MRHIVVDLETLGNHPMNGMILALGAVAFDIDGKYSPLTPDDTRVKSAEELYMTFNLDDQIKSYDWKFEHETIRWWVETPEKMNVLKGMLSNNYSFNMKAGFCAFENWIVDAEPKKEDRYLWSHGSTFDCMHIALKWQQIFNVPFTDVVPFRNIRDTRTLFALYQEAFGEKVPYAPSTNRHHALVDAMGLARSIQHAWQRLKDRR